MTHKLRFLPRDLEIVRVDRKKDSTDADDLAEVVRHVFDAKSVAAVNASLAAQRPLLVRGEPGVGKTQLAAAVAAELGRPLVSFTVNARTEPTDLLWKFDAVQRLAEAQICSLLVSKGPQVREVLAEWRFVAPGPLWWGFAWQKAMDHLRRQHEQSLHKTGDTAPSLPDRGGDPKQGVVVLIDEIDKADTDVPNGLLEALGARGFTPLGCDRVEAGHPSPLVIITTNEERVLPDPFIRRCLVLHLKPSGRAELIERGQAHFGTDHQTVLESAADRLLEDRKDAPRPQPGLAEYLDLVRAILELSRSQGRSAEELMAEIGEFTLRKQSGGGA